MLPPFDPTQFKVEYPEFSEFSDGQLNMQYRGALRVGWPGIALWDGSIDQYDTACLVLAHLCQLIKTGQVGMVSGSDEGTIKGQFTLDGNRDDAYWNQTQYGTQYLQMIKNRGGYTYFDYTPTSVGSLYTNY